MTFAEMSNQWATMLVEFYNEKDIRNSKVSIYDEDEDEIIIKKNKNVSIYDEDEYRTIMYKFYKLTEVKKDLSFEDAQKNPSEFFSKMETYFSEKHPDYYEICHETLSWIFFKEKLNEYICQHKNPWAKILKNLYRTGYLKNMHGVYGNTAYNEVLKNFYILTEKKNLSFEDAQKNPSEFIKKVEKYFSSENPNFYRIYCYETYNNPTIFWSVFQKQFNEYICQN